MVLICQLGLSHGREQTLLQQPGELAPGLPCTAQLGTSHRHITSLSFPSTNAVPMWVAKQSHSVLMTQRYHDTGHVPARRATHWLLIPLSLQKQEIKPPLHVLRLCLSLKP